MKKVSILVFLFAYLSVFSQENGSLRITDSIVVKKRCKDAVELNIHISFPTEKATTLYQFNENVNDQSIIVRDSDKNYGVYEAVTELNLPLGNKGLFYIIEDEDGNQIKAGFSEMFVSYLDDNPKASSLAFVDKKKLKVHLEKTENADRILEYDMAKIIVPAGGLEMKVYPMIVRELKRGRYKLFLCYSQYEDTVYEQFDANRNENESVFYGVMVSNKIDLIVR